MDAEDGVGKVSRNGAIGGGATHVIDRRRHAPVGRGRFAPAGARAQGLPQVYRGRSLRNLRDIYDNDHAEARRDGRFRWLVSTCLAAAVGAVAIVVVIYGSLDPKESADGLIPTLQRVRESGLPSLTQAPKPSQGLAWASPRADKLQLSTGATATRFIIHETLRKRRNGRDYIENKPYARIVARLSPVPAEATEEIPAFNPFKLYANTAPVGEEEKGDG